MIATRHYSKKRFMLGWLGLPLGLFLFWIASLSPGTTEKVYSRLVFRLLSQPLSLLTGLFPFSLTEAIVVTLAVAGSWMLVRLAFALIIAPRQAVPLLVRIVTGLGIALSTSYILFVLLWGMNYSRLPFADIVGLSVQPTTTPELSALCRSLILQANELRLQVSEDADGVMDLPDGKVDALRRGVIGYERLSAQIPELKGSFGRPKPVLLSAAWSFTGIGGMYFPLTGEANVNVDMPDISIPMATVHEMAHQRGFAREDEANYIAYLVCMAHPDADYQYSGTVLALSEAMQALYRSDSAQWEQLQHLFGAGLRRDLQNRREYWERHQGKVAEISQDVNDRYLKANNQADGVQSYGRMVDLLLAQWNDQPVK